QAKVHLRAEGMNAKTRHAAGVAATPLRELAGVGHELVPRLRSLVGVEAGRLQQVLVPVEQAQVGCSRYGVVLAVGAAGLLQRRVDVALPIDLVALGEVV